MYGLHVELSEFSSELMSLQHKFVCLMSTFGTFGIFAVLQ